MTDLLLPGFDTELAWAAGMFEGEGSIRINKPTKWNMGALLVDMVNTDPTIPAFYQERWPGFFRHVDTSGDDHHNRRDFYRYLSAALVAARLIEDIFPYLKTTKYRERAILGLEFQRQKLNHGGSKADRSEYLARQWAYYERMKELNLRGRGGLEPWR